MTSQLQSGSPAVALADHQPGAGDLLSLKVKLTQLKGLFEQLPVGLVVTLLNGALLAWILSSVLGTALTAGWYSALVAICVLRAISCLYFAKVAEADLGYSFWRRIFAAGALSTAIVWGLAGVILFPSDSNQHQAFIGFVLAGMAAGASSSMAAHDKIFTAFLAITIAPYMVRLAAVGSPISLSMSFMCLAFILSLAMSVRRNAKVMRDALRLKFENASLLDELTNKASELKVANAALVSENAQRQQTESALLQANADAEAATRAKSQFLANMSHEIRTPMNGVFGMTDLLMRTNLDARQTKLVKTISDSAKSLLTIINDILDLSRIESGKLELEHHEFNFRDMIERSVDLFAGQAHRKGIDISLFIDRETPAFVKGDSGRLKQVILNLVGNALKFTKHGEIAVRISCVERGTEASRISIEVRDTGIGIDPAICDKLFKPFSQAETSISRRFGGTGLGLSISRHLVEMMGGSIALDSELGKGTRISIMLPLEHGVAAAAFTESDFTVLEGARILVIDDRETNREIVTNYLESCGSTTSRAASTAEAWPMIAAAAATGKPFHAAVVDMMMPDENGLEFAKRIRAHATFSRMKIIIATSLNWQGDIASVRDAGIEAVLTKPIRRNDLIDTVARAVSGTRHPGWRGEHEVSSPATRPSTATPLIDNLGANVLLAEDNPVNVEVAKEFLQGLGCRVFVVENGLEAVAAMASTRFDIVLMDCQMPVMDGLSATRRIRSGEDVAGARRTPIIAVTANAFAEDRVRCLEAGMDDYLSKPYSERSLFDMLAKWLRPSAVPDEASDSSTNNRAQVVNANEALSANDAADLDHGVLDPLRKARPDLFIRLVSTYFTYAPKALEDLELAAATQDFDRLSALAHSLKSSSANLGASAIASYCRKLERVAAERHSGEAKALVDAIVKSFARLRDELQLDAPSVGEVADNAGTSKRAS